jgi:ABC-type sugar transport system permease subunit
LTIFSTTLRGNNLLKPKKDRSKTLFILSGLIPVLVWSYFFMAYPLYTAVARSFSDWALSSRSINFIGLDNYRRMFADRVFVTALKNTFSAVAYVVPLTVFLSTALGIMLNSVSDFSRQVFTPIYFLPSITSTVAIASVWRWLYHPTFGLINYFLGLFGIAPQPFIKDVAQALPSVCMVQVWQETGYYAIIILAALKAIPAVYYEAATIDGAGFWNKLFRITIPLIKPNILFVCIMSIIGTFQIFIPINIMTKGGPGDSTQVLALYIYQTGITRLDMGYASAIAMVLFAIIMAITVLQWKFVRSDWDY